MSCIHYSDRGLVICMKIKNKKLKIYINNDESISFRTENYKIIFLSSLHKLDISKCFYLNKNKIRIKSNNISFIKKKMFIIANKLLRLSAFN